MFDSYVIVSKLFIANDYRLDPSYNHPFTKSDDEANKRVGVQIHEHLLLLISTVDNSGSKDNKIRTDETNNNSPTKRLGEVDCTRGRIFINYKLFCKLNTTININENRSLS